MQPLPGCGQILQQREVSEALEMIGQSHVFLEYVISHMFQHLAVPDTASVLFLKIVVCTGNRDKDKLQQLKGQ